MQAVTEEMKAARQRAERFIDANPDAALEAAAAEVNGEYVTMAAIWEQYKDFNRKDGEHAE